MYWPRRWAMLTSNMSGASCAATRWTSRLARPGARATTRILSPKPPMLLASTSARPRRPCAMRRREALDPGLRASAGYLKLPNGRALTGQSHDYRRDGTTTLFAALEVATGRSSRLIQRSLRVEFLGFMKSVTAAFPGRKLKNEHWLKAHPNVQFHFTQVAQRAV